MVAVCALTPCVRQLRTLIGASSSNAWPSFLHDHGLFDDFLVSNFLDADVHHVAIVFFCRWDHHLRSAIGLRQHVPAVTTCNATIAIIAMVRDRRPAIAGDKDEADQNVLF